jgi:hypothetical protein
MFFECDTISASAIPPSSARLTMIAATVLLVLMIWVFIVFPSDTNMVRVHGSERPEAPPRGARVISFRFAEQEGVRLSFLRIVLVHVCGEEREMERVSPWTSSFAIAVSRY